MASNTTKTIGNVIKQARQKYEELMESEYISVGIKIDGVETRGQAQDADSVYSIQDKNSKLMTCLLDIAVERGSLVELQDSEDDAEYIHKGIVTNIPAKTPVDHYFTVLFFNCEVIRHRQQFEYNDDGDIINDNPEIIEKIPCYVERVGYRERQIDVGIDRNSVNKLIAHKSWDVKKNDILFVGSDRYRVIDIEELEKDYLVAYMTYYRE